MNKLIYLLLLIFGIGCAPQAMYYYGNYSDTLYSYKKKLTPETLEVHKKELQEIINKSERARLGPLLAY